MKRVRLLVSMAIAILLVCYGQSSFAQEKTITGRVTDSVGNIPLAGVSVTAKGTTTGTQTGADGTFKLIVPASVTALEVSLVGYETREFRLPNAGNIEISLSARNSALNEVVVVGYGASRKKDLTGSVTVISSKDFNKGQISTPEQLIAGKVAGVQVISNSGAPGAGSRIRIRGGASLNASNDPLIVIDGVPIDNGTISGAANPLSLINPNDIESFNVLKDASATAIYGSRASNGVIIITTKKGVAGKPKIHFSTLLSASYLPNKLDVFSADQFREIVEERGDEADKDLVGEANTDWQDEIYETAITSDNNLSVRGSAGSVPFRVSIGYLSQQGILKTGKVDRYSGTFNLSPKLFNEHLRVDLNFKGAITKNRFANEGAVGSAVTFDPTQPVTTGDKRFGGYFEWLDPATGEPNLLAPRNPVALLMMREDESTVKRALGNAQLDYKFHFLPELRANLNLGFDMSDGSGTVYVPDSAASQYSRKGRNNEYHQEKENKLLEFYLNYAKEIPSIDSRFDILGGYGYQDFITTVHNFADYQANGEKIPNSDPKFPKDRQQNTLVSFYGRLNYTFKDRYLLTATLRRDGSSRFSEDNRWGTFPSAALAWRINQEAFMRNATAVTDLKLRVGYGVTGQQDIGQNYSYLPLYALSNNSAQYQLGSNYYNMYRPAAYDANIKWEETETYNIGLDFGFINNRITGSIEYYMKRTSDLLAVIPVSVGSNFSNEILTNVGSLENRGVEVTINTTPVQNADLIWDFNVNATYNVNEITKLTKVDDPNYQGVASGDISGGTGNKIQMNSVGYNKYAFFVYRQVYGEDGRPIEGLYEDINQDGVINEKDRYRKKSADPKVYMGVNSAVTYKNWTASFSMRGSFGNYTYNNVNANIGVENTLLNSQNILNNGSVDLLNTGFKVNQYFSDYYVQNASFLKMDYFSIGYDFGRVISGKANLRLTASVQNVFTITDYDGLDPEIPNGVDNNIYPRPRTVALGLNLDF